MRRLLIAGTCLVVLAGTTAATADLHELGVLPDLTGEQRDEVERRVTEHIKTRVHSGRQLPPWGATGVNFAAVSTRACGSPLERRVPAHATTTRTPTAIRTVARLPRGTRRYLTCDRRGRFVRERIDERIPGRGVKTTYKAWRAGNQLRIVHMDWLPGEVP